MSTTETGPRWRCAIEGRDGLHYEEWRDGAWLRLDFASEQLSTASPHHVLFVETQSEWHVTRPVWVRQRRDEIVARLRSGFGSGVAISVRDDDAATVHLSADEARLVAAPPCAGHWTITRLQLRDPGLDELYYEETRDDGRRPRLKLDSRWNADRSARHLRPIAREVWNRLGDDWPAARYEQVMARIRCGCPPPEFIHDAD